MEKVFILSNNPLVWQNYPNPTKVDGNFKDVLIKARDFIHGGHRLISHPLAGSVKPNETCYKSLILSLDTGFLDFDSLQLIESAIQAAEKFVPLNRNWEPKVDQDFQLIDFTLLKTAVEHLSPSMILS